MKFGLLTIKEPSLVEEIPGKQSSTQQYMGPDPANQDERDHEERLCGEQFTLMKKQHYNGIENI